MSHVLWNGPRMVDGYTVMAALYSETREWICVLDDGNTFDSDVFTIVHIQYKDGGVKSRAIASVAGIVPALLRAQEEM